MAAAAATAGALEHARREHWTDAYEGPRIAGRNLLARCTPQCVEKPGYLWSDQYGTRIQSAGEPGPCAEDGRREGRLRSRIRSDRPAQEGHPKLCR